MSPHPASVECPICRRQYSVDNGVVDLAPPAERLHRSVTQRVIESRFYARLYEEFSGALEPRHLPKSLRLPLEYLELDDARSVLDVGCGSGALLSASSERTPNARIVGCDLGWPMLEAARRRLRAEGRHEQIGLVRAEPSRLPFGSGVFDRVHCRGVLQTTHKLDDALFELARVLQVGGVCVVISLATGSGRGRRLLKRLAEVPTSVHWFAPDELEGRLTAVGLTVTASNQHGDNIVVKAHRPLTSALA